ncbi:hypothetical protein PR202_ga26857 [Eleusine coracana subsp. coracana]|uniref:Protein kinase domain-containing protein n=1 Tax=Eleusine coracana subsp. coracana TaxID=191504 RepID=A0AAV5DEF7_ELECO|nr:hypothetical protein PR202_ga26857 [Eleusine coracana subsp. coracana]
MARPAWAALFGCFSSSSQHAAGGGGGWRKKKKGGSSKSKKKKKVAAAAASGSSSGKRPSLQSRISFSELSGMVSPEDLSLSLAGSNLHVFTIADLRAATRGFSMTNFIGEGGFGPVYKGYVDDKLKHGLPAQPVAVKLLDLEGGQGHTEWLLLVDLSVLAVGFQSEYAASLPWSTRLKIAIGAAKGLAFLHEAEKPVIYRDFKTSNILLDSDYKAKLSDFGLAKDGPEEDETHVSTRVMGTQGYAAPEYIMTGHLTAKSDVYGFGVVLLELLTGRKSVDRSRPPREQNLVEWARPYLTDARRLDRVMDPNVTGQYSSRAAQKAAAVAHRCVSLNPKSRPHMSAVVEALEPLLELDDGIMDGPFVYVAPPDDSSDQGGKGGSSGGRRGRRKSSSEGAAAE